MEDNIRWGTNYLRMVITMTKEQSFFLQVLSDHLNGRKTIGIDGLDWNTILYYARRHQVSGIFYVQAKEYMPLEIVSLFQKEMVAIYLLQSNRECEMLEINRTLNNKKIPFFIIKGPVIGQLYPIPELRSMGDIDLVIQTNNRETCHDILLNRGYRCLSKQEDREWQYVKNGMEFELHDRLVYQEAVTERKQELFINNCWKYVKDGQLDWNFHLLFLIFHLRKHLINSGVGFRHFLDIAIVAQKVKMDWKWIEDNLKKTEMSDFAKRCYGFIFRWFGVQTPLMSDIDNAFFEQATEKIFADGVFGFGNKENDDSLVINQVRHDRFPKIGMIRLALCSVFPGRKELKDTIPYTYLDKYPVLLPIAWFHRMIRGSKKGKTNNIILDIKNSFTSKDQIEKRIEMLNKWGL